MTVGSPLVAGVTVKADVIEEGKDKKVIVYKYKSKKSYHKKKGHRQPYTKVKITKIEA
jgi:large subunit ribosomal protein L21